MTPDRRPPTGGQAAGRSAALVAKIRTEIERSPAGRITFAHFMNLALNEPRLGYYRQASDRPTDAGDFLTAPETHAIFGWTIAHWIERMWADLGRPRRFHLIEYGAGSGTLALSILDGFRRHDAAELLEAVRYRPIESNPNRLAELSSRFDEAGFAGILEAAAEPATGRAAPPEPAVGVVLANEFLDALPVHRTVLRGGKLLELYVVWRDGFAEVAAEPSTPELAAHLADDGVAGHLAEGQVAEICLDIGPWLDDVAGQLARGYVLAIDYGYEAAELYGPRHLAGTLLGYRGHRVVENPFTDPGQIDLTAHVDFTAVRDAAARRGFAAQPLVTQQQFLMDAGLEAELQALQASPDLTLAEYTRARSGIVRMLDPRHMGRFRVLIAERGGRAPLLTRPEIAGRLLSHEGGAAGCSSDDDQDCSIPPRATISGGASE
jgi:SAM-dependent MidA family methyltransferase